MRRLLLAFLLAVPAPALAQSAAAPTTPGYIAATGCPGATAPCFVPIGGTRKSAGAGQMALAVGTATTLTVPAGASIAEICVETANIRYRDDGTNATATLGIPVNAGTCFQYSGPLSTVNFTAQSGSPTIDVLYYK